MTEGNETTPATQPAVESASGTVTASDTEVKGIASARDAQNFIETYHAIAEWIRFADAKAAVILTVGGALAGFLIPTIKDVLAPDESVTHLFAGWKATCLALFGLYVFFFLLSGIFAFLCINPFTKKGRHPSLDFCQHFHPAAIANSYTIDEVQKFVGDCESCEAEELKKEVQAAILLDSHISSVKYRCVKKSLFCFAFCIVFGFSYFLVTQL